MPEQFLVEVERQAALLEAELRWLEALIDRLELRPIPWGPHELPTEHFRHATSLSERLHSNDRTPRQAPRPEPRHPTSLRRAKPRSPWPALWALVIGFFMILVDTTIVSVANPAIKAALDPHTNNLDNVVWVTSAYLLAYAVPLLITGRLGDRFGPKNIYLVGARDLHPRVARLRVVVVARRC